MNARRWLPAAALTALAVVVSTTGCQNPFDPSGDLRLIRWAANADTTVQITFLDATGGAMLNQKGEQNTTMILGNFSSVGVRLTSYVVVYRQIGAQSPPVSMPPGSPIPSLGGAGGRRYPLSFHIAGLENNTTVNSKPYAGDFYLGLRLITRELLVYIGSNSSTMNGGIDCEVEVFGTDHNGHDVKVVGVLHVEVF